MWAITLLIVMVAIFPHTSKGANSGWNDTPNTQYHIQTDEGPERFFRYQTISGQYRKEKRLQDGTVVGTTGWVDPNGYLRLQDYIADREGYRILKSKMVFVGNNEPIQKAVAISKNVPAQSGILVSPGISSSTISPPVVTPSYVRVSPNAIETSTKSPLSIPRVEIVPNGFGGPTTDLPYGFTTSSPIDSTEAVSIGGISSTLSPPPSSTYFPITSTLAPPTSTYLPSSAYPASSTPRYFSSTTPRPFVNPNSISYTPRFPPRKPTYITDPYKDLGEYTGNPNNEHPWAYQVGGKPPSSEKAYNQIGNGYTPQYPEYDGVSVTRNGFRYYLPRLYHEEETQPDNERHGSFGYIDPFGIRRVVYYNAGAKTGFTHRKNNRYVGFNATPYDPRPVY